MAKTVLKMNPLTIIYIIYKLHVDVQGDVHILVYLAIKFRIFSENTM